MKSLSKTMRMLVMPKLSPTMTKGKINNLFLKELQAVTSHDVVFEVATDTLLNTSIEQSIMDIEIIEDMIVARVFAQAGSVLPVGRPIALLCDGPEDVEEARNVKVHLFYNVKESIMYCFIAYCVFSTYSTLCILIILPNATFQQIPENYSVYDAIPAKPEPHAQIPMAMWQAYAQVEVEGCK